MDNPYNPLKAPELQDLIEWGRTEAGLQHKLNNRLDQLARLADLGAPAIILENQVRMVRETEEQLIWQTMGTAWQDSRASSSLWTSLRQLRSCWPVRYKLRSPLAEARAAWVMWRTLGPKRNSQP